MEERDSVRCGSKDGSGGDRFYALESQLQKSVWGWRNLSSPMVTGRAGERLDCVSSAY